MLREHAVGLSRDTMLEPASAPSITDVACIEGTGERFGRGSKINDLSMALASASTVFRQRNSRPGKAQENCLACLAIKESPDELLIRAR
jgi:hypothetical protein